MEAQTVYINARIDYVISEAAQRAAIQDTAQPVPRTHHKSVLVPVSDLELLDIDSAGNASLDLTKGYHRYLTELEAAGVETWNGIARMPSVDSDILALIKAGQIAKKAKRAAEEELARAKAVKQAEEQEAVISAFFSDPEARGTDSGYIYHRSDPIRISHTQVGDSIHVNGSPRRDEALAEIRRRNQHDQDLKDEAELAQEEAKLKAIEAWVELQDEDLRLQYKDGLLARKRILSAMADAAFDAYGVPEEFKANVCGDNGCTCGITDKTTIPPAIYKSWRAIAGSLPEGTKVEFEWIRECSGDWNEPLPGVWAALIKMPAGPFQFDRRIRLKGSAA